MTNAGKRRSILEPMTFARELGEYLWHLVDSERGDRSGRWLAARADRSSGYWEKILNLRQAMTTNDIAIIANLFNVSPYQFIRDARSWNENLTGLNVSGMTDDELSNLDLSQGQVALAATTDRTGVKDQTHPDYESESQDPED